MSNCTEWINTHQLCFVISRFLNIKVLTRLCHLTLVWFTPPFAGEYWDRQNAVPASSLPCSLLPPKSTWQLQ